ncbi:hypothetical protein BCV70DRAFT_161341 [Testicularia cyperi]|uniref:Pinin/SDK/MemA protein domain-containing protein n=1 Tax=Testicularia cyperi TaxID=1882483 RepID=A0A317XQ53_9BASI|nr:hypothetical protein BCV70DRAFT_161341 [Testicularia cyperi]
MTEPATAPEELGTSTRSPQPTASTTADSQQPASPMQTLHASSSSSASPTSERTPARRGTKRHSAVSPIPENTPSSKATSTGDGPPETKRARRQQDPESRRRGQRMFGVLSATLTQFKREAETSSSSSAARRRAQVEARSAARLANVEKELEKDRQMQLLAWEARDLAEEIASREAQRKTVRAMKRRMASFLFTSTHDQRNVRSSTDLAPEIPLGLAPLTRFQEREARYPLYFLPGNTLPAQEDIMNDQEDSVDDQIDSFDDAWVEHQRHLLDKLDAVKHRIKLLAADIHPQTQSQSQTQTQTQTRSKVEQDAMLD